MDRRPEWMKSLTRLIASTPAPAPSSMPRPTFGTVKQLDPLRIALDNDPLTTLPYSPPCLDYPTHVGQRVWVETYGRQVVIVGVSKSAPDFPVGTGALWTGPVGKEPQPPWMLMEGQLLLRTDYPELSALYGSTFTGSTATHVALPDARGRTAVHRDTAWVEFDNVGDWGGEVRHTLTVGEMPSHAHSGIGGNFAVLASGTQGLNASPSVPIAQISQTAPAGGGGDHNNLQPYIVQRYIVRVR